MLTMGRKKASPQWNQSDNEEEYDRVDGVDNLSIDEMVNSNSKSHDENQEEESRFAQYLDSDEDLDTDAEGSSGSDKAFNNTIDSLPQIEDEESFLRKKLESIPFSALAKAKRTIRHGNEDDLSDSEIDEFDADRKSESKKQEKKAIKMIEKRGSKHAPTELSSRRPVSRKRSVVETASFAERRDPRFSSLSASKTNKGLFRSSYGFLREQQSSEIRELRTALTKLKRQEKHQAGPKATSEFALRLRQEREQIEQALRREEGRENERQRRERKDEVLRNAQKEIDERVQKGGKRYYLKESDKKKLILQDKFEHLSNGQNSSNSGSLSKRDSLQKAVERRRKKNSAKDRQMPLGGGASGSFVDGSVQIPKRKRVRKH